MINEKTYKSILANLSKMPAPFLEQIDAYLQKLAAEVDALEEKKKHIRSFYGMWKDMPEEEFQEILKEAKKTGSELFNRDVEI
jgi:hypothetical protein